MHSHSVLLFLGLAWIASAVPTPLNINLGAYSPALVVGDGAIGFGAAEGGAAKAAEGAAAAPAAQPVAAGAAAPAAAGAAGTSNAEAVGSGQQTIASTQVRNEQTKSRAQSS